MQLQYLRQEQRAPKHTRGLSVAACLVLLAGACTGDDGAREQGRQLLEALTALQDVESLSDRSRMLDELVKVPLANPEHAAVRQTCVEAHRQLLQAEIEQASAKQTMETASAKAAGGPLPGEVAKEINAAISRSDAALAAAKQRFPECQRSIQGLMTKLR